MPDQAQAKQEIISAGRRLAAQGLVYAHSGNISSRLDQGSCLITASGVLKSALTEEDVLRIDYQGRVLDTSLQRRPSSETGLHTALYRNDPQIAAIVHAHPPYATALASAGQALNWRLLEESRLFLGPVPLLPQLPAGSAELARAAAAAAADVSALLLAGHGAISWGESMEEALCRMEIIEHTARVMLLQKAFLQAGAGDV